MNIGVFAMDPGGHTGLAWGIFDPGHPDGAAGALKHKMLPGSATVEGVVRAQITGIATLWHSFYNSCVNDALLPPDRIWFVAENFIYAPGVNYEGDSAMYSTALIWGVEGYRMGRAEQFAEMKRGAKVMRPPMILQPAGQAATYATNARLRYWGLWVVGREHERSAWRHVALFLSRYIQQHGGN